MSELTEFLLARIDEDHENADRYVSLFPEGDMAPLFRRVLRECEAKRRIVEELEAVSDDRERLADYDSVYGLRFAAQALAAVYADHPDYRDDWRP